LNASDDDRHGHAPFLDLKCIVEHYYPQHQGDASSGQEPQLYLVEGHASLVVLMHFEGSTAGATFQVTRWVLASAAAGTHAMMMSGQV
jgi:hypothetical protein